MMSILIRNKTFKSQALSVFMVILNILKLLLGYGPLPGLDESFDKVSGLILCSLPSMLIAKA